ncbi:MAG: bifunctional riboflavin kinase/FAD synthetase [Planctomycetes bacterium]|nr:bifunctional riboflavin kinase/FAD synthetase [Planctomycetota bacterium]
MGTFDGVHLGHQAVIRQAIDWAREVEGESVILTFDQHPRAVLSGMPLPLITSLEHRLVLFERLGIDVCAVLEFNQELASVAAEPFVEEYLVRWLGVRGVLLGYDCRFGKGARGNVDLLQSLAPKLGFSVRACEQVRRGWLLPSSTAIRQAIASGHLDQAEAMLGRPFSVFGPVRSGECRGRHIGFPTANLSPPQELLPPRGVYACRVEVEGEERPAVANIGVRPTIHDQGEMLLEVHLLDFDGDLYGRKMEVRFIRRLRGEEKFPSLDALKAQIARDVQDARRILVDAKAQRLSS